MFTKKEILHLAAVILILAFASSIRNLGILLYVLFSIFFIVVINVLAKKITSYYYESEVEMKIWEIYRYGLTGAIIKGFKHPSQKFKKPIMFGAILPVVTSILSLGYFTWFASLVFDVKPKISRAAKRHGLYSYSEMSEEHIGYIAASGILINLIFAILGYLLGFSEFARLSVIYAFFNMLPISELDGNKIFFGNIVLWSFLAALSLVGIAYVLFVV